MIENKSKNETKKLEIGEDWEIIWEKKKNENRSD